MEQTRITGHQGAQGAHAAHAARGKQSAQAAGQSADPGGFLSLLTALGGGLQDPLGPQSEVMDLGAANDPAAADAAALAALQGGFLPWQAPDAIPGAGVQATAALAGVQGLAGAQGLALSGVGVAAVTGPGAGLLPQNGLVAQTAMLDATLENQADDADAAGLQGGLQAPAAGGGRRMHSRGQGVALGGDVAGAAHAQVVGKAGMKHQTESALTQGQGVAMQPQALERREAVATSREVAAPASQDVVAGLSALVSGATETAPAGRESGRGGEPGGREPGAWGQVGDSQELRAGAPADGSSAVADPAMVPTEDAVAEQVAFWVHQNIQNAELTVKHDGQPVEVSVSLTGNEAHVAFRSDQAQTRDLLDASVAQLRDMLHQEGLVLSGVTVGDSGSQPSGDGGAQRGQRGEPRSAQVVVPAVAGTRTRSGGDVLSDRAVDIFV